MKKTTGTPRGTVIVILAVLGALCLAACGSSSASSSSASKSASAATSTTGASGAGAFTARRAKLVACLKKHGVTLPNRPARKYLPGGAGAGTAPAPGATPGTGTTPSGPRGFFGGGASNPKFATAFKDCGADFRFRGGPGAGAGHFRPHFSTKTLDSFVACVKQHGYDLPKPNTSGKGPVFPASIERNAKFQKAAKSCGSILRSGFHGPPGGPPPAAS